MDYYSHAIISARKFNCNVEDTAPLHKLMDRSKMYFQGWQHRLFSHNTFFIDVVVDLYGDTVANTKTGGHILTRDILMEHCREDFSGKIPDMKDWLSCVKFEGGKEWVNNPSLKELKWLKENGVTRERDNRKLIGDIS